MNRTECLYEQHLRKLGYIEIYDGEAAPQRPNDPTSLKPEERRFFIRYYQLVRNNHLTNEYVKLVFDKRANRLSHFPEHYRMTTNKTKQAQDMMALFTSRA